ncbi:MAG: hypothetical protein NTY53_20895 [Kiritimatiellaeota bacterium]|nr:hypothetical protein [Kiritimatiellota bacterium]
MSVKSVKSLRVVPIVLGIALAGSAVSCKTAPAKPQRHEPVVSLTQLESGTLTTSMKLLRISAMIDGSCRISFTHQGVRYEHKSWAKPKDVMFDGEPWQDLDQTPPVWEKYGAKLDLSRAYIAERKGRDVIALETTPDGFDLYFADSPNGSAPYSVTIMIPMMRR